LDKSTKRDHVPGLGAKLVEARNKLGISQAEAARQAGIQPSNLNVYEKEGRTPGVAVLMRLAVVYRVKTCDLIPDALGPETDTPEPETPAPKPTPKKKRKRKGE
jgi:transcriptional regulator with XRE-family HTH domain